MNKIIKLEFKCLKIMKKLNKFKNKLKFIFIIHIIHKSILLIKKRLNCTKLTAVLFQFIEHT